MITYMLWGAGLIGAAGCAALAWTGMVQRRVREQTATIRCQVAAAALLHERCETLIAEREGLERELLEISNREQRRIGHDLHDGVCQQLAAIAYRLDSLGDDLQVKNREECAAARRNGELVGEAMAQTRAVARGLFPVRLEESGLAPALAEFVDNTTRMFGVHCEFQCDVLPLAMDKTASLHLFFIAQEAISNSIKHGQASRVIVTLIQDRDRLGLSIQDNGRGFQAPGPRAAGMGIRIMRYRARLIGAGLEVKSVPGAGTEITCALYTAR